MIDRFILSKIGNIISTFTYISFIYVSIVQLYLIVFQQLISTIRGICIINSDILLNYYEDHSLQYRTLLFLYKRNKI